MFLEDATGFHKFAYRNFDLAGINLAIGCGTLEGAQVSAISTDAQNRWAGSQRDVEAFSVVYLWHQTAVRQHRCIAVAEQSGAGAYEKPIKPMGSSSK